MRYLEAFVRFKNYILNSVMVQPYIRSLFFLGELQDCRSFLSKTLSLLCHRETTNPETDFMASES